MMNVLRYWICSITLSILLVTPNYAQQLELCFKSDEDVHKTLCLYEDGHYAFVEQAYESAFPFVEGQWQFRSDSLFLAFDIRNEIVGVHAVFPLELYLLYKVESYSIHLCANDTLTPSNLWMTKLQSGQSFDIFITKIRERRTAMHLLLSVILLPWRLEEK